MSENKLNGFLNILKPPHMSSARVVAFIKHKYNIKRIGHAGTLDPEACGVLPIMLGRATKLFDFMLDKEKSYICEVAFGAQTDTLDAQGKIIKTSSNYPSMASIEDALNAFLGDIMQVPPEFSALKQNGKRLYSLAREGKHPDIKPRETSVYSIKMLSMSSENTAFILIKCKPGFYVRSFCRDLGEKLHCPAHMKFLLRTQSGSFFMDNAVCLEELNDPTNYDVLNNSILSLDFPLKHKRSIDVAVDEKYKLKNGVPINILNTSIYDVNNNMGVSTDNNKYNEIYRIYCDNEFFGMGEIRKDQLKTIRLVKID